MKYLLSDDGCGFFRGFEGQSVTLCKDRLAAYFPESKGAIDITLTVSRKPTKQKGEKKVVYHSENNYHWAKVVIDGLNQSLLIGTGRTLQKDLKVKKRVTLYASVKRA